MFRIYKQKHLTRESTSFNTMCFKYNFCSSMPDFRWWYMPNNPHLSTHHHSMTSLRYTQSLSKLFLNNVLLLHHLTCPRGTSRCHWQHGGSPAGDFHEVNSLICSFQRVQFTKKCVCWAESMDKNRLEAGPFIQNVRSFQNNNYSLRNT